MKIYCQTQYAGPRRNVQGLTLIEMMVGLAIGLVIALAAASAYLGTRGAAVATENVSRINETGKLALDFIGTEIRLAGFFPADQPTTLVADMSANSFTAGSFTNIKLDQPVAYNQGFFGCDEVKFKSSAGANKDECPPTTESDVRDSIVINYFSSDIFGIGTAAITGLMRDCSGSRLDSDPDNHESRDLTKPARNLLAPPLPMFISNRIGLNETSYTAPSGQAFSTFSLSCNGNGNTAGIYQPIFEGVENLVIRYGVYGGANSQSPEQFYTATQVSALPLNDSKTGWQRVSAVQVCIVVRSLENARLATQSGTGSNTYEDCRGRTIAYPAGGSIYKRFTRIFAAKNNLNLSN